MLVVWEILSTGSESSNKSPELLLDGLVTSEHMSALLPFKFPGKYDAILDSFVTTTPTMHVRAAKPLFDVIMHKVCYNWLSTDLKKKVLLLLTNKTLPAGKLKSEVNVSKQE